MQIYDIEVYKDLFLAVFYDTEEFNIFEKSPYKDEIKDMIEFISKNNNKYFIGYNNQGYDDQILHYICKNPKATNEDIKEKSDEIINSQWGVYAPWENTSIPKSIDIMKVNNYGIYGKNVSLKQIAFNLRDNKLEDLPIHHSKKVNTRNNIDKVIQYCKHDVMLTYETFKISKGILKYRKEFGKLTGINIISDSEVTLVKKIFAKTFSEAMNIPEKEVKKLRTYRDKIVLKDFIPDIKFRSKNYKELNKFYKELVLKASIKSKVRKNTKVISTNKAVNYEMEFKNGLVSHYGLGGIHGTTDPGVYEEDENYCIVDLDFASYYPHNIWEDNINPAHLPEGLLGKQLKQWFKDRKTKYPKSTHYPLNYALKIMLNLTYGQFKSEYSLLYDQACAIATCVSGMLKISKLTEEAMIMGADVFYQNTDGICIKVLRSKKNQVLNKLMSIADEFNIPLEAVDIKKFVMKDVSNILVQEVSGKVKEKGEFERYETIISQNRLDKNCSAMIIPEALYQYFINDIPVEETIYKANNIHDFCIGVKGSNSFEFVESYLEPGKNVLQEHPEGDMSYSLIEQSLNQGVITNNHLGNLRMIRYYVATEGSTLTKFWTSGKKENGFDSLEANNPVKLLMNIRKEDINDFDKSGNIVKRKRPDGSIFERFPNLDREFYITKAKEIIKQIKI